MRGPPVFNFTLELKLQMLCINRTFLRNRRRCNCTHANTTSSDFETNICSNRGFTHKVFIKTDFINRKLWKIGKKLDTQLFEKRRKTNAFTCTSFDEI